MKMPRIKFEWSFLTVLLFPSLLDLASGAIQLSHHKATKELGANFMVTCRDDAGRSVSWSGPKGPLGTKTHPGVEVSSYGTSLVFMSITKDDSGTYICRAGHENAQFHLTVEVPLTFMDTPPEQVGRENRDVTLRCEVKGGDKSVLIWTSEGKELPSPKYEQMGDGLLIRNVTRADSKTYTCRAMQLSTGNIRDQKITLKVERYLFRLDASSADGTAIETLFRTAKPACKVQYSSVRHLFLCSDEKVDFQSEDAVRKVWFYIVVVGKHTDKPVPRHPHLWKQVDQAWGFIGGDVNLTCEVDANPPPKFEWYRKNRLLILKDRTIYEPHRSILQLHINNSLVFGDYKCKAWNKLGKLEKFITLQQGVQPEPPDFVELRKANALSLDLEIRGPDMTNKTVILGMEPVGYRVQFKALEENVEWDRAGTVDFPKRDEDIYTIIDLNRDTSYEIRVATRNVAGISEYTNTSIFRTLKSSAGDIVLTSPYLLLVYLCCPIFGAMLL